MLLEGSPEPRKPASVTQASLERFAGIFYFTRKRAKSRTVHTELEGCELPPRARVIAQLSSRNAEVIGIDTPARVATTRTCGLRSVGGAAAGGGCFPAALKHPQQRFSPTAVLSDPPAVAVAALCCAESAQSQSPRRRWRRRACCCAAGRLSAATLLPPPSSPRPPCASSRPAAACWCPERRSAGRSQRATDVVGL